MLVLRGGRPREVDVTRLGDVVELRLGDAVPADLRRASLPLVLTTLAVVVVGALMPITPFAPTLGFQRAPARLLRGAGRDGAVLSRPGGGGQAPPLPDPAR
ncbi:hypothetical protein SRO_6995 [Streptomyces rochei]|nr:hypothetical protein SRO_6995 [Streptomyces rochei]